MFGTPDRHRLVALLGFALVFAVSCSSGGSAASRTGANPAAPGAPGAKEAPAATPKRGGTIVNLRTSPPLSFDPHFTLTWPSLTYESPVFSQLVRVDPTKSFPVDSSNIVPDLAERWEISIDGKVMTFFLRKGVKWHNGTPFTARDVKYSIERMADPKISFLAGDFANVASVETPDEFTVRVIWKVPSGGKLSSFATGYSVIVSADHTPGKDRKKEEFAMGTGPFKLVSSKPGQEYRYERNPDYFIAGLPYLDALVFKVVTGDAVLPAMISGQGDTCGNLHSGCASSAEAVQQIGQQAPHLRMAPVRTPRPLERAVYFNTSIPGPLQSADVRRALALVVDRDGVIARYGGTEWAAASGVFLPGMALDLPQVNKLIGWDKSIADRVTEARALMAKAGYANGFKETAMVRNNVEYVEVMSLVTEAWKKHLNVEVKLDTPETAVEVDRRSRFDYRILWYFPTMKAGIHPSELASQFGCSAPENWARYCNAELDALFAKMGGIVSGPELKTLAREAETILLRDMPVIPLAFPLDVGVNKADVQGVVWHPWLTNEDYLRVWLNR